MTDPDPFKRVEDEYFRLRGQLSAGRITREQFDSASKALMVQDAQGRYWTIGADNGKWYVHDGSKWIETERPRPQAAIPTSIPERGTPPSAVPPSGARKTNLLPLVLVSALVVLGAGIAAFLFFSSTQTENNIARQATADAAANSTLSVVGQATPLLAANPTPPPAPPPTTPAGAGNETPTPSLASSNVPGVQVAVIPAPQPSPIMAKDFASLNAELAEKIAELNVAELKVIRDLRALAYERRPAGLAMPPLQAVPQTEQDIKDMAGKGMEVAILADDLGNMAGKQDKGSKNAAQSADTYFSIARTAWSLVIDSQTVRQAIQPLQSGAAPIAQAIDTVASYGAQLWNNEVTDGNTKGNPFSAQTKNGGEPPSTLSPNAAAQVQTQSNGSNPSIWIAQSGTQTVKTLQVPAAQSPVPNPFDPQVLKSLTTAEVQSDSNKAQQVAAANLQKLGAQSTASDPSKPTQLQVPTNSVAVAEGGQIKSSGNLPTFPTGKATIVSKVLSGDENTFLQNLGLDGDKPPSDEGKTEVKDPPALVNLTISNIVIDNLTKPTEKSTFEATAKFSFKVTWSTTLGAPNFNLSCIGGNNQTITQSNGSLTITGNAPMILYPGAIDVFCYATSDNGTRFGSADARVLVGDEAGATERALQVETDSESLNRTFTAEAQGTADKQNTDTAATVQVLATQNALETEVAGTETVEFKLTAAAFGTKQAQPPPDTATPTTTPTFTPKVVDQVFQPGNVMSVNTTVVLQRGRMYRFTFGGRVNLINPTHSAAANELPEHVNGVTVPASGIVVIEGTGSVATITCGSGEPDPNDPGGYSITVEDLGPM